MPGAAREVGAATGDGGSLTASLRACFLGQALSSAFLVRVPLETDPEIKIYMQEFYWGMFLGSTLMQKIELCSGRSFNCNAVSAKTSVLPHGGQELR